MILSKALHAIAEGEHALTLERPGHEPTPIDAPRVLRFAAEAIQYPDFPMHGVITSGRARINDVAERILDPMQTLRREDTGSMAEFLRRAGLTPENAALVVAGMSCLPYVNNRF